MVYTISTIFDGHEYKLTCIDNHNIVTYELYEDTTLLGTLIIDHPSEHCVIIASESGTGLALDYYFVSEITDENEITGLMVTNINDLN